MFKKMKILGLIFFAFVTAAAAQDKDQQKEIQKIFIEYEQIFFRLQIVQQQALSDPQIKKEVTAFHKKLDSIMVVLNPSIKDKIERRDKILDSFDDAKQNGDSERMSKLKDDYLLIVQEIQVHQEKALKSGKLKEESKKLSDSVIKKMTVIDPAVPKLIARLEILNQKIAYGFEQDHMV